MRESVRSAYLVVSGYRAYRAWYLLTRYVSTTTKTNEINMMFGGTVLTVLSFLVGIERK